MQLIGTPCFRTKKYRINHRTNSTVVGGQCVVAEIDIEDQIRSSSVLLDSSVVDSRK